MALFCETCNIGVSSEVTMRDHVKGRRHQQAVAAVEKRKAAARCSLYCRDFPPSTTEAALRQYFSQFGNISRVMLEKQRGCYCILHFDNEAAVQRALAYASHRLGGNRLTVRPRKPITPTTGHGQRPDPRASYQKAKAAALEEEEAVKQADYDRLMHTLLQCSSVLDQMEMLYQSVALSNQEVQSRHEVCQYLHHTLLPFFPTCTFHQFGSSVNGFGMHGCDMDVFVDFHDDEISPEAEEELRQKFRSVELPYIRDIRSINTTLGPLLPSQLREVPILDRARLLSRILTYHGKSCGDVTYIPSARCPIARFVHMPTGIKCDMSVNNRLGLMNTRLLRMCAEDRRVRLLVFAVRYWGKWRQVAGNVASGPRLSNYCLSLLVYFYLANTTPPVLPTVQQMADIAGPDEQRTIEGWDCSLPALLGPTQNTQTADDLLQGFFQFFSEIDLSSCVLLMRSATTLPLHQLLANREHDPILKDFKVKAMAVQDPFVLSHNIALNVNGRTKDLLAHEIRVAANKTSTWTMPNNNASPGPSAALWGLPYLFSSHGCQVTSPVPSTLAQTSAPVSEDTSQPSSSTTRSKHQTCLLSLDLSTVTPHVFNTLHASGDYRSAWYRTVQKLLLLTLREIFLFDVQTEDGRVITDADLEAENFQQESEAAFVEKQSKGGERSGNAGGGGSDSRKDQSHHGSTVDSDSGLGCGAASTGHAVGCESAMASAACLCAHLHEARQFPQNDSLTRSSEPRSPQQHRPHSQTTPPQVPVSTPQPVPSSFSPVTDPSASPVTLLQVPDTPQQMSTNSDPPHAGNSPTSLRSPVSGTQRSPDNKAKRQRRTSDCVSVFSGRKRIRCGDSSEACSVDNYAGCLSADTSPESAQRNVRRGSATHKKTASLDMASLSSVKSSIADDGSSVTKMLKPSVNDTFVCSPTTTTYSPLVRPMDVLSLHVNTSMNVGLPFQSYQKSSSPGSPLKFSKPGEQQPAAYSSELVAQSYEATMGEAVCLPATAARNGCVSLSAASASSVQGLSEPGALPVKHTTASELGFETQSSSTPISGSPTAVQNADVSFTGESSQDYTDVSLTESCFADTSVEMSSAEGMTNSRTSPSSSSHEPRSAQNTDKCKPVFLRCKGHCRTWNGRKPLRSQLLQQGHGDGLDLEKRISQEIFDRDSGSSVEPIIFLCKLFMVPDPDKVEAEVVFEPCTPLKEFQVFVTFFRSFFPKLVSRNLTQ